MSVGYIYMMHRPGSPNNVFKVGKTINQATTKAGYERSGNVNMIWCPVRFDCTDNAEKLILNIFSPYRTQKTTNNCLLEEITMDINILKIIIEWCVNNVWRFDISTINRCVSVNTISKHRNKIPLEIWTDLCDKLIESMGINYPFPMLISENDFDFYAYLLNQHDFDQCLKIIHEKCIPAITYTPPTIYTPPVKHVTFAPNQYFVF